MELALLTPRSEARVGEPYPVSLRGVAYRARAGGHIPYMGYLFGQAPVQWARSPGTSAHVPERIVARGEPTAAAMGFVVAALGFLIVLILQSRGGGLGYGG